MEVKKDLLQPGQGVRTGLKLTGCLGLVVHWIGAAQGHASVIRGNFSRAQCGTHYICDWHTGEVIQCVPEDEVCYHVGSSYGYTALKERLCGGKNPNWYLVGVECCIDPDTVIPADYGAPGKYLDLGRPSPVQYRALVALAADFLTRHGLGVDALYRHYDITGKVCHAWFVKDQARWERFKADVERRQKGEEEMTREEVEALVDQAVEAALARREQAEAQRPVSPWAADSWRRQCGRGLFDGTRPGSPLTREQAAVVLERLEEAGTCER